MNEGHRKTVDCGGWPGELGRQGARKQRGKKKKQSRGNTDKEAKGEKGDKGDRGDPGNSLRVVTGAAAAGCREDEILISALCEGSSLYNPLVVSGARPDNWALW